jgi:UDP-N-acetylglucosamine--N-acetylmuramyl-(pentapeptide) pyrophosphoryl-undecaprenol N-acetylglucosamine transferase
LKHNKEKKTIVLTGGGSAGHVMPNLTLLPDLLTGGWDVHYIGSKNGIEASLTRREGLTYHAVSTGKLRRYADIKNIVDPFRVLAGIIQSIRILKKIRPLVIFSKGGFVAVPVVLGGRLMGIPSVIHESDMSQGLANKICTPFSAKLCVSFEKTLDELPARSKKKAVYTGAPVRPELGAGSTEKGLGICGFDTVKPVLLAIGGSQGSESLNRIIRSALPELLKTWQVAHICGKGNADDSLENIKGYAQFDFAGEELAHLYKISSAAVSRAGSNAIFELLNLKIPAILIPLPLKASRGDQILNAEEFEKRGYCIKLDEKDAESVTGLLRALAIIDGERGRFVSAMRDAGIPDSKTLILKAVYDAAHINN